MRLLGLGGLNAFFLDLRHKLCQVRDPVLRTPSLRWMIVTVLSMPLTPSSEDPFLEASWWLSTVPKDMSPPRETNYEKVVALKCLLSWGKSWNSQFKYNPFRCQVFSSKEFLSKLSPMDWLRRQWRNGQSVRLLRRRSGFDSRSLQNSGWLQHSDQLISPYWVKE